MSRNYERTFSVSVAIEAAWRACTDPEQLQKWFFQPVDVSDETHPTFDLLGSDVTFNVLEVDAPHRLRYTQGGGPMPVAPGAIETCMTFEADAGGTRITITHSGFGDGGDWDVALESISRGSDETVSDLILFLETGVGFPRHPSERSFHGVQGREAPAGFVVASVTPGSFGAELGLQPGDILVEVDGGAVFGYRELWFFTRVNGPGTEASAAWIREGVLHRGSATLTLRPRQEVSA